MGGHHIGSHGWSHRPFTTLTNAEIVAEIKYSEAAIYSAAKVVPRYFRPPLGDIDDRVRGILWALGYRVVLASTNPVRDLTDATGASISPIISGWGINKPGFIGLEQDIDSLPKLDVAVNMLNWLTQSSSKLKLQSITDCLSVTPYVAYSDTPSPTTHTAKRTKSTSALMPTASTPPVKSPAPTGSGVTQAIEHDHVYSDAQGSRHYYVETMAAGAAALVTYLMLAM
ncbi:hypothetical protein DFS34DRAFT_622015 [Phlyctochytrium arcticum]|nr:hypothetical protein DFS34DRAFT_622015 [Phlyctochytrium arcticum]